MDSPADHQWFLRKHEDGSIFGPLTFEQLASWASSAQIAPHDSTSTDQANWTKAPMLPELGMDWIVEITSERLYGPTTLGAIREFMRLGEIGEENFVINACDASRQQVRDLAPLLEALPSDGRAEPDDAAAPTAAWIAVDVNDRIRELEDALREERRNFAELEQHYRDLEQRYNDLVTAAAASQPYRA
ncbi:MAG: hypothetical protein AVDCRST_MAG42-2618 [uncultured Chthoniobacterales bacterium]|uniref:GYF domain-containing protein n=1 Tax=uncultured Chthoniobacterales bacterium TaxID=1836801 RepID=A0A6J4IQF0_9BACT|nr:MAG: hypothetical protein AVDCRST_MAG42-2618 [uncultured Chthoniobacterales bacterium]